MASLKPFRRAGQDYERIDPGDLAALMRDCRPYATLVIVDCRSAYEYQGGHIQSARHCQAAPEFEQLFRDAYAAGACFVFHCEFSQFRGPAGLEAFREVVRGQGAACPALFVLDKGYRGFYSRYRELCCAGYTPQYE
jgi:M-phase inducer tyrosine phosphatase